MAINSRFKLVQLAEGDALPPLPPPPPPMPTVDDDTIVDLTLASDPDPDIILLTAVEGVSEDTMGAVRLSTLLRKGVVDIPTVVFDGDRTGATDVSAAVQAMFDAAANRFPVTYGTTTVRFLFRPGTYRFDNKVLLQDLFSPVIEGFPALEAVKFRWYGANDRPMIEFNSVTNGVIKGITFGAPAACQTFVRIATRVGGFPISTACRLEDVWMDGSDRTTHGIYVDSHDNDANNEFHHFLRVSVSRCTYGMRSYGSQAHRWLFDDCSLNFNTTNNVWIERGAYGFCRRTNFGYCPGRDVEIGSFAGIIEIDGHNSEGSNSFFRAQMDAAHCFIRLANVRWDGSPTTDWTNVISIENPGPVEFAGVNMTSENKRMYAVVGAFNQVGGAMISGLNIRCLNPPSGDMTQKVLKADPAIRVVESGAIAYGTVPKLGLLYPPADLTRELLSTSAGPYVIVESTNPVSIADPYPVSSGRQRSWGVSFQVTFASLNTPVTPHPNLMWVKGVGIWLLQTSPGVYQFRAEGSGYAATWVGVTTGVKYTVVVTWDRDVGTYRVRFDTTIGAYGQNPATITPSAGAIKLGTTLAAPGPTDCRFNGTIENIKFYDRALEEYELPLVNIAGSYTTTNLVFDALGRIVGVRSGTSGGSVTSFRGRTGDVVAADGDLDAMVSAAGPTAKIQRLDVDTIGLGTPGQMAKYRGGWAGGYVRILNWNEDGWVGITPSGTVQILSAGNLWQLDSYALHVPVGLCLENGTVEALDGTPVTTLNTTNSARQKITASADTIVRGFNWTAYAGSWKFISNAGPGTVTFTHNDGAVGETFKRWDCPGGANLVLPAGSLALCEYDGTRMVVWRVGGPAISTGWNPTNVTADRVFDANATTVDEVADVLGTLINDLKAKGVLGG